MDEASSLPPSFTHLPARALVVGLAALLLCVVGWIFQPAAFFRAWLYSWLFWLAITLGSLVWVMVYHLVGGGWGRAIKRPAEAAALNLPLMAVLFIPVLFGLHSLYPWANPQLVQSELALRHKAAYLNSPLFIARAAAYFVIWIAMAWALSRLSRQYDRTREEKLVHRMRAISAGGLVVYTLVMSLACVDWIMSRDVHWYSTVFGFIIVVGQALAGLVFLIVVLSVLVKRQPLAGYVTPEHWNDLGNLVLTCVILWAYVSFAQLLVTWTGNIRDEVRWYVQRSNFGYKGIDAILIIFHFFVPFFLLLGRNFKRDPRRMAFLAAVLLILRLVADYWMVMPTGEHDVTPLNFHWLNFIAPIGIGGVWISVYLFRLSGMRLLAEVEHTEVDAVKVRGRGRPRADVS